MNNLMMNSLERDFREVGWKCICHKIQYIIFVILKKYEDQ
jgi:hypothetical protein